MKGLCERGVIVTGHRTKREREANEESRGLVDSGRGEFSGMKVPKETENRVKVTE